MQTLRVKLTVPDGDSHGRARDAFDELAEIHADQAIFQVNQTPYVDEDSWGFQIRYETKIHTSTEFVQSTSLADIEQVMSRVAPRSFEQRVSDDS